ncbi:tellurite resistance/C4-dicarboxylate transporter family protein [Nocardia sp. NPDC057227]|uniref:tellurite resistance/C4-dicarboxylate transporter family protein n=1 Tax=Nocardia sp. NPDC057227 TaxID=3346056 RepID=UPI00362D7A03
MAQRWWRELPPAAGSFVMATEIVSTGLHLTGFPVLSWIWFALGAALWVLLAVDFLARLFRERDRWRTEADTPPALTAVAATTVLGTRIALGGFSWLAFVLLAVAVLVWPVLLTTVIRHWGTRMPGAAFLVCVATQGLAVLGATLGGWLVWPALACFGGGLLLYVVAFLHFDLGQVLEGRGDQWVATGALAISALACAKLLVWFAWLRPVVLALLALALAGYLVLMIAEVVRPRPGYDIRRWATVFPLGMTAVACSTAGTVIGAAVLRTIGAVLLAVAVGAWLLTVIALLRDRLLPRAGRP